MSLLRYFIIDSLTFSGKILPNQEDLRQIMKIYLLLIFQFGLYYVGSVFLFYFIIENWFSSALIAVLFTFIYFSISMVLLSGLRSSSYLKKGLKKNTNKSILIGSSTLEANEVAYDYSKNKNEFFSAVFLRAFFIIVFGFFIFIGLVLGISLYTKPNLDEQHRNEIIQQYSSKKGKETEFKIKVLTNKLKSYRKEETAIEGNYQATIDSLKSAKDETHKMIFSNDTAYFHKKLLDWKFAHQNEINGIPQLIKNLQVDYDNGYKKLELTTNNRKFGIYRIHELSQANSFLFWFLFLIVTALFVLPYYIRFKMVITNSALDIALEEKIVSTIKNNYRSHQEKLQIEYLKYGVEEMKNEIVYEEAPFRKHKNDEGEIVALKNQMNIFLNNEL